MKCRATAVAEGVDAPVIWCGQHSATVTCGRRTAPAAVRAPETIPVLPVDRGGEATWHGPGQLVIYPIVPISRWANGVRSWVNLLLQCTRDTLQEFGVPAEKPDQQTGLWTTKGKIVSLGIRIDKGVNLHGLAINVDLQPNGFIWIDPCGVAGAPIDMMSTWLGRGCVERMSELAESWYNRFLRLGNQ